MIFGLRLDLILVIVSDHPSALECLAVAPTAMGLASVLMAKLVNLIARVDMLRETGN